MIHLFLKATSFILLRLGYSQILHFLLWIFRDMMSFIIVIGHGKEREVSTYFRYNVGKPSVTVKRPEEVNFINIYRSQSADNQEIIRYLLQMTSKVKPSLICGDFNLCYIDERDNQITRMLEDQNFKQLVTEASHFQGGHIDHVYSNLNPAMFDIEVSMYSPYYTSRDHDGFCTSITHKQK